MVVSRTISSTGGCHDLVSRRRILGERRSFLERRKGKEKYRVGVYSFHTSTIPSVHRFSTQRPITSTPEVRTRR